MPKVSTAKIQIYNEGIHKGYTLPVWYSEKVFFIEIPEEFNERFDLLTDDEKKKYSCKLTGKPYGANRKRVIYSTTEETVQKLMETFLNKMAAAAIKRRNVIIIEYTANKPYAMHNDYLKKSEFPEIGLKLGLTYCEEIMLGPDKKEYRLTYMRTFLGEKEEVHKQISIDDTCLVIDDSPESRAFLENLYNNLIILRDKIEDFTSAPEKLLKFISSKQKLIN